MIWVTQSERKIVYALSDFYCQGAGSASSETQSLADTPLTTIWESRLTHGMALLNTLIVSSYCAVIRRPQSGRQTYLRYLFKVRPRPPDMDRASRRQSHTLVKSSIENIRPKMRPTDLKAHLSSRRNDTHANSVQCRHTASMRRTIAFLYCDEICIWTTACTYTVLGLRWLIDVRSETIYQSITHNTLSPTRSLHISHSKLKTRLFFQSFPP